MLLRSLAALLALSGALASASVVDPLQARDVEDRRDHDDEVIVGRNDDVLHVQDEHDVEHAVFYHFTGVDDEEFAVDAEEDLEASSPGVAPVHPPVPPPPPDTSAKTIFQILAEEPKFHKAFKFVNFTEDIAKLLNDSSSNVTFFVPPDWALKPPRHHGPPGPPHRHDSIAPIFDGEVSSADSELDLFAAADSLFKYVHDSDDDDKKEKRKKILKAIIKAILSYHIIPSGSLPAAELVKNSTYATHLSLNDGSLDGKAFRLRIAPTPKIVALTLSVNIYAKVVKPDIKASNGILHEINHPLIPPGSTFQSTFFLQQFFSTVTSALQRVDLTDEVEWRHVRGSDDKEWTLEGSPAVTFFAPSNGAFKKLPPKLKGFLFSPFGERALKKILQYHIVPETILHTDYIHNASDSDVTRRRPMDDSFLYHPDVQIDNDGLSEISCIDLNLSDERHFRGRHVRPEPYSEHRPALRNTPVDVCSLEDIAGRSVFNRCGMHVRGNCQSHLQGLLPTHCNPCIRFFSAEKGAMPTAQPATAAPIYELNITSPTLLTNHSLHIHVVQHEYKLPIPGHHALYTKTMLVNGHRVCVADIPSRNGAIHVVDKLLNPIKHSRRKHGEEVDEPIFLEEEEDNSWDDWEEWLPRWAGEN
ncbi:FAS1 domain-containing protein [Obba rivulosa]|uniref:FAS1 domain-containing protein n=1 Tax=Obba rivulosa TaxID=1052685 RepID=A0A8E2DTA7_9APHY|nr:FAS1 domain-containing protein [Obba rivulosa]